MTARSLAAFLVLALGACADAPITAADLQSNGELRQGTQHVHAVDATAATQHATHQSVTGVIAAQADGPLEDATRFSDATPAIHLHLRAEDIAEPRPVIFVWTHVTGEPDEQVRETLGFLQPSETLRLAASLPLELPPAARDSEQVSMTGTWKVEVFSAGATPQSRSLLFEREFEVLPVDQYEALAAAAPAGT